MNKKQIILSICFATLLIFIFGIIMTHELKHGDFPPHINWAKEYNQIGYLNKIPHVLFAKLVVVVRALLPANLLVWVSPLVKQVYDLKSFEISTLLLMVSSYLLLSFVVYHRFLKKWEVDNTKQNVLTMVLTLTLLLLGPIFLFTYPDRMFLGYIAGNRYDSPTYILAKPFILIMFISLIDNFYSKWNWKQVLIAVIAVVCATLAKPNFTISILPAIVIVALINIKEFKKFNKLFLFFAIGVTSLVVLFGQFLINYAGDRGDRIIVAPFKSILYYVPNIPIELFFIVCSLLFPILITIKYWSHLKKTLPFQLAWVNIIISLGYSLLLAEQINYPANNFWNGNMIGMFILFFVSIEFWGKDIISKVKNKSRLFFSDYSLIIALGLHLLCGIIYYFATLANTGINVN